MVSKGTDAGKDSGQKLMELSHGCPMFPGLIDITSNPPYTRTDSPCLCGSGLPRLMVS